jgi:hypothetical protein
MKGRHVAKLVIAGATLPLVFLAACGSSAPEANSQGTAHTTTTTARGTRVTTATVPPTSPSSSTTTTPTTTAAPPTSTSTSQVLKSVPAIAAPTTTTVAAATTPPVAAAGGLVAGHVTAVGDSVMLDYQADLEADIPGVDVEAAVSRQWETGEQILQELRSEGRLGSVVVVALGTNGPITSADFDSMMAILAGVSRVVFVTIVVDQPWQNPNNAVLSSGVARYSNTVIADWYSLESQNPGWVYSDGTHLPIGGAGAQALASLIASKV